MCQMFHSKLVEEESRPELLVLTMPFGEQMETVLRYEDKRIIHAASSSRLNDSR